MSNALPYIAILAFLCLSAFFSGSEIAYNSINAQRLRKEASEGRTGARLALKIYDRFDLGLTAILIGNTLVNLGASAIATVIVLRLVGGGKGTLIATAIMTVLIITFGEILPKVAARRNVDFFVFGGSGFLTFIIYLLYPFVFVFSKLMGFVSKLWKSDENEDEYTEDELSSIIETVEDEGVIDEDQGELLQSAIEFSDRTVQEILTPRVDVEFVDINDSPDEIKKVIFGSGFSRIPVYDDGPDDIIGILPVNRYFKAAVDSKEPDIRPLLLKPLFVHKAMGLPQALSEMKKNKNHMAVVTDEYGGTMGIVTLEDVMEELVGEIWDETDEVEEEISETEPGVFMISGDMGIYDMLDELSLDESLYDGDYTTAGGWAIEMLKGYPTPGDSFEFGPLTVTIEETDDMRILKLRVKVAGEE